MGSRFRVQGSGFRVQGSGFGVPRLNSLRFFSAKNLTGQARFRDK